MRRSLQRRRSAAVLGDEVPLPNAQFIFHTLHARKPSGLAFFHLYDKNVQTSCFRGSVDFIHRKPYFSFISAEVVCSYSFAVMGGRGKNALALMVDAESSEGMN